MFGSFPPFTNPITDPMGRAAMWSSERMIWAQFTIPPREERIMVDVRSIKQIREQSTGGSLLILDTGEKIPVLEGYSKIIDKMRGILNG